MTSLLSKTAAKASGAATGAHKADGGAAAVDPRDTAKYLLRVTAGPSYDASTHGQVAVNGAAYHVENALCAADVTVRIRDYHGLPRGAPASDEAYFGHPRHRDDRYSIAFSLRPRRDIPGAELVMGFDFDRPIRDRLPPLFRPALRLVTSVIDPGIYCDAYADKPYLYGPGLSSFFILRIGDKDDGVESEQHQQQSQGQSDAAAKREPHVVAEGADGEGRRVREAIGMPENSEKRRRWFLKQKNLDAFTFEAGREYEADFFNPYLDFANFAVRLPGFSISVAKYIDEKTHQLRYVLKNRRTDEVYFVVVFTLLFGKQLKAALREGQDSGPTSDEEGSHDDEDDDEDDDEPNPLSGYATPSPEPQDQHLKPPSQDGLMASLGRWLPRVLRSGGTASGSTTPGSITPHDERGRSMDEERPEGMSDEAAQQRRVDGLSDARVAETLRARHTSGG